MTKTAAGQPQGPERVHVCSLTPVLPTPASAHAGGVYVWRLHEALTSFATVHYLVPDLQSNKPTMATTDARTYTGLLTQGGLVRRILTIVFNSAKRLDAQAPFLTVLPSLLSIRSLRAIRNADVLDIQWSDWAHWSVLRVVNPRVKLIVTLHDITSQSAGRRLEQARRPLQRAKWTLSRSLARLLQVFVLKVADQVVVLSDKDRDLLAGGRSNEKIVVVSPPLETSSSGGIFYSPNKSVLFLAYFLRQENAEALEWFIDLVWPEVFRAVPDAQLRIVGTGLSPALSARLSGIPGVRVEGFIECVDDAYRDTQLAVVPLRSGAGVKFKSIDPLLRGLPVVATSVGAEGIGGPEIFTAIEDDPIRFANAVQRILLDPKDSVGKANRTRVWAEKKYGMRAFALKVETLYSRRTRGSK
nr:glycosyltransferase family 4 protein [Pseudoclavibacter terrae]